MWSERLQMAQARETLNRAIRDDLRTQEFLEVETPLLVPAPGQEPQITAFEVAFVPETSEAQARTLYLHTSPEYAMKRLLADGFERIYSLSKVFRNGEVARDHNPEFTLLEFYRAGADYRAIMDDVERLVRRAATDLGTQAIVRSEKTVPVQVAFERLTVREAVRSRTGIDIYDHLENGASLAAAARAIGVHVSPSATGFDDVFFHLFLEKVERTLGWERPCFLIDYPRSMASLSRLKADDPRVAERFELYAAGLELCNGFTELTDAVEQRVRLVAEQEERRQAGRPVYPLDERFLAAVAKMPAAGGAAVGLDRVLMLLLGKASIAEVLLFPAREFLAGAR